MSNSGLRITAAATTVVAIATFAIALGATSAWSLGTSSESPTALLREFSQPATPDDAFPMDGKKPYGEGMGLLYDTSRFLGETKVAGFWVVQDDEKRICLVTYLHASATMGFSCVTASRFAQNGASAMILVDQQYTEAYLVPDSLKLESSTKGLTQVATNLVAGDSRSQEGAVEFASRVGGQTTLELPLIHPDAAD